MLESTLYFFAVLGTIVLIYFICLLLLDVYTEANAHCKEVYTVKEQHRLLYTSGFLSVVISALWAVVHYLSIEVYL